MKQYTPQRTRLYRGASTGAGRALGGRGYLPRSYGDPYYDAGYAVGSYIGNMVDRHNDKKMDAERDAIANNIKSTYGGLNMNQGEQSYLNSDAIIGDPNGQMVQQVMNPPTAKETAQGLALDSMKNDYLTYGPNARQAKLAEEEIMQNAQKASAMNLGMTPWEQVKQQIDSQVDGSKMSYRRKQMMKEQLYSQFQGQATEQANKIAGDLYMQRFTMNPEEWKKQATMTATQLLQAGQTNAAKLLMQPIEQDFARQQQYSQRMKQLEDEHALKVKWFNEDPAGMYTRGRSSSGGRSTVSDDEKANKQIDAINRRLSAITNQLRNIKDDDSPEAKAQRDQLNRERKSLEERLERYDKSIIYGDGEKKTDKDGVVVASGVKAGDEPMAVSANGGFDLTSVDDLDYALETGQLKQHEYDYLIKRAQLKPHRVEGYEEE